MRKLLQPHPQSGNTPVKWIEVEIDPTKFSGLEIKYKLGGAIGEIRAPEFAVATRADDLWRHSCFELFLRCDSNNDYLEFNFSPSTQWAVYKFSSYRKYICDASQKIAPKIRFLSAREGLTLTANIKDLPTATIWHIGLSAIIEETSGAKSYWALAHPPGDPDFHHSDCLALKVAAAERP